MKGGSRVICPHCRAETDDSAERCDQCGAWLVATVPDSGGESELRVLLKTSDLAWLAVIKSLLDSAGIDYMAQGEEGLRQIPISWPGGFFSSMTMGVVLWVRSEDLDAARALIEPCATPLADDQSGDG